MLIKIVGIPKDPILCCQTHIYISNYFKYLKIFRNNYKYIIYYNIISMYIILRWFILALVFCKVCEVVNSGKMLCPTANLNTSRSQLEGGAAPPSTRFPPLTREPYPTSNTRLGEKFPTLNLSKIFTTTRFTLPPGLSRNKRTARRKKRQAGSHEQGKFYRNSFANYLRQSS